MHTLTRGEFAVHSGGKNTLLRASKVRQALWEESNLGCRFSFWAWSLSMNSIDTDMFSSMGSQSAVCVLAGGGADVAPKCHSSSLTNGPRGLAPRWALAHDLQH